VSQRWRDLRATHSLRLWFIGTWRENSQAIRPVSNVVKGFSLGAYNGLGSEGETIVFNTPDHACQHAPLQLMRWTRNGSVVSYEIDRCYNGALVTQVRIPTRGVALVRYMHSQPRYPEYAELSPRVCTNLVADLNHARRTCHVVVGPNLRLVRTP
jgi:hypothetical protein